MAKKNKNRLSDLSSLGGFVFSTNNEEDFSEYKNDSDNKAIPNNKQFLEAHFSNKGRGGKIVTVIKGFEGADEDLNALGKLLKQKCGVGGSVKDGEIIIQGNYRDKIIDILKKKQYNVKRIGG